MSDEASHQSPPWGSMSLIPAAFYFVAFTIMTWPALGQFSTHFFTDAGDGLQNVWNLWWTNRAVHAGQSPWFTNMLHFPHGTTLVAHTLAPHNGFLAVVLTPFFSLLQIHNGIVVFCFVASGLTAFWLAWYVTRRYVGSLIAGYIFTFSSFHFAHAEGHLNLISCQWIPLFLLAWCVFLDTPSVLGALGAAGALFLVELCDYYYFFFCVLSGALVLAWYAVRTQGWNGVSRRRLVAGFATYTAASLALCGPLAWRLVRLWASDPLEGAHDATLFSMDLLAPLIPGGHWRYAAITRPFWEHLRGSIHETSVHWGLSAIILMAVGWRSRGKAHLPQLSLWGALLLFFSAMALGPQLYAWGQPLGLPGPFAALERLIPPLRMAGCPVRMCVLVFLCLGILAGAGFARLWAGRPYVAFLLLVCLVFEYLPTPIPQTGGQMPAYVARLSALPKNYGMFDADHALGYTGGLYYQTVHEIPMVHGYISRVPQSVTDQDEEINDLARQDRWQDMCELFGIRYLIFRKTHVLHGPLANVAPMFAQAGLRFYDAGALWTCRADAGQNGAPLPLNLVSDGAHATQEGAVCAFDLVNRKQAVRNSDVPTPVQRSSPLQLFGWALDEGRHKVPGDLRIRLIGAPDVAYEGAAQRIGRPDVAAYFHDDAYERSGVRLAASLAGVVPGVYRVKVLQGLGEEASECDGQIMLSVR